jgi:hypothetical protein
MPRVLNAITENDPGISERFPRNVNKCAVFMDMIVFSDVAAFFKPVVELATTYPDN